MRGAMIAASAAAALAGCAAWAGEPPPPVCGDPGVLRQVGETIEARGQRLVLEAPPVGEVSGPVPGAGTGASASPPLAYCAVRGHTVAYDTNRYGTTPLYAPFIIQYTVEQRRNGLFVSVD